MMTWIDVADTAVKIGLAAVISGVGTYLVTSRSYRQEFSKEKRKRRRELLEDAANQIMSVAMKADELFLLETARLKFLEKGTSPNDPLIKDWKEKYSDLFNSKSAFAFAEAKLRLLGEKTLCDELDRLFATVVDAVTSIEVDPTKSRINEEDFMKKFENFRDKRKVFFDHLSNCYLRDEN